MKPRELAAWVFPGCVVAWFSLGAALWVVAAMAMRMLFLASLHGELGQLEEEL